MMNSEKGQVLPLAMLALALGSLVITPFIAYASSSLIGARVHEEVMTEQYSCDAGIEWALWKLKGNPLLTTSGDYVSTPLLDFPGEINSSSFPTTEIKFVAQDGEDSETEPLDWVIVAGWNEYELYMEGPGTISLLIETDATFVKVKLGQTSHFFKNPPSDPPHTAEFEIESEGLYLIEMQIPPAAFRGPVTTTVTTTYPAVIYDIRARKDNTIITARAKASDLGVGVISWQVE